MMPNLTPFIKCNQRFSVSEPESVLSSPFPHTYHTEISLRLWYSTLNTRSGRPLTLMKKSLLLLLYSCIFISFFVCFPLERCSGKWAHSRHPRKAAFEKVSPVILMSFSVALRCWMGMGGKCAESGWRVLWCGRQFWIPHYWRKWLERKRKGVRNKEGLRGCDHFMIIWDLCFLNSLCWQRES